MNYDFIELQEHERLKIVCGPVTLGIPTAEETFLLAKIVHEGLFPDGESTLGDWYNIDDPVGNARKVVAYQFSAWNITETPPGKFPKMPFAIRNSTQQTVGVQSIHTEAEPFRVSRELGTGSWIDPMQRNQKLGFHARCAMLHVGFDIFGADSMLTSTLTHNAASNRVSQRCGYAKDGLEVRVQNGQKIVLQRYRMDRGMWLENVSDRPPVTVVNPEVLQRVSVNALNG